MTREEYEARRDEIVSDYLFQIDEHESAGDFGDADNARKWMRIRLRELDEEYAS